MSSIFLAAARTLMLHAAGPVGLHRLHFERSWCRGQRVAQRGIQGLTAQLQATICTSQLLKAIRTYTAHRDGHHWQPERKLPLT
eukprot:3033287-Pleurochrysis_carterae.AAC.2